MFRKILTVLLSLLMVWYAAEQVGGAGPQESSDGIRVYAQNETIQGIRTHGEGEICITAALQYMQIQDPVIVHFVLESDGYTYRSAVVLTPQSQRNGDLLTAAETYTDLPYGSYTLRIESITGAVQDHLLAEDGSASNYDIEGETIIFDLTEEAQKGSAWFILRNGTKKGYGSV